MTFAALVALPHCGPAEPTAPTVRERVVAEPARPLPDGALLRVGGSAWGVFGATRETGGGVIPLESGRWVTWVGLTWELWDPALGLVRGVQPPQPTGFQIHGPCGGPPPRPPTVTPDSEW